MNPQKREVIEGMDGFVAGQLGLLKPVEDSWRPQDFLPDMSEENWKDSVNELRVRAEGLPDDLLVVLVGDMVTEEALPTYQSLLNGFECISDKSGTDVSAWARCGITAMSFRISNTGFP